MIFGLLWILGAFRGFRFIIMEHKVLHIDDIGLAQPQTLLLNQPDSFL